MNASTRSTSSVLPNSKTNLNANQDESLARLHYLTENRRRVGLVLGAAGVGKTTLLRRFARESRRHGLEVAFVDLLGASDLDVLWNLVAGLGVVLGPSESRFRLWRTFVEQLQEHRIQRLHTLLIFDHADQATNEVVTLIQRVTQADVGQQSVTCLLAAQPTGLEQLGTALLEQVDLRIDLEAWSFAETVQYLDQQSDQSAHHPTYRPDAVERLHELTGGVPRKLVQLNHLAQLVAAANQTPQVDPFMVSTVFEELSGAGLAIQV